MTQKPTTGTIDVQANSAGFSLSAPECMDATVAFCGTTILSGRKGSYHIGPNESFANADRLKTGWNAAVAAEEMGLDSTEYLERTTLMIDRLNDLQKANEDFMEIAGLASVSRDVRAEKAEAVQKAVQALMDVYSRIDRID